MPKEVRVELANQGMPVPFSIESKQDPFVRVQSVDLSDTHFERATALKDLDLPPTDHQRLEQAITPHDEDLSLFHEEGLIITAKRRLPAPYWRLARKVTPETYPDRSATFHARDGLFQIDFAPPKVENDFNPKERTSTMVAGLLGLEDYTRLVNEGILPKPKLIFGYTNERLAKFAARAGFQQQRTRLHAAWMVAATYEDVNQAVASFDPKLKGMLLQRHARQEPAHSAGKNT